MIKSTTIDEWKQKALEINANNSSFRPGIFKDEGTFEAIFSKYPYYENDLDYAIAIFVSLQKCHVFHDGNKRTSLALLLILLVMIGYSLTSENQFNIADVQLYFIEHQITEAEFIRFIKSLIIKE